MKLCNLLCRGTVRRWFYSAVAALLLVVGCASPRPPRPPSLNLPGTVNDLTAQRVGNQVELHWTTPEKTTDHLEIRGGVSAEICRIEHPGFGRQPACTPVKRLSVGAGVSKASDLLPESLTRGDATLLAYRIQLFNAHGRSAGLSPEVFAAAGATPPPVEGLQADTAQSGAVIKWERRKSSAYVELNRELVQGAGSRAGNRAMSRAGRSNAPAKTSNLGASGGRKVSAQKPPRAATAPLGVVKLRTPEQTVGPAADPGGIIDSTAAFGDTYRYTAGRVLTVSLDGHVLTLRSVDSAPVMLDVRDTFPPAVPTGLEAVSSGGAAAERSIDLSWTPDTEADLAGYRVYRQKVGPDGALIGRPVCLAQALIPGPAYRDQTAVTGQRYAYRVSAIDTSGNESAPSADVQETVREP